MSRRTGNNYSGARWAFSSTPERPRRPKEVPALRSAAATEMIAPRPYRLSRTLAPGADPALRVGHWRLVCFEPGSLDHAPSRFRRVHTCGYVFREGSYWTADPSWAGNERPIPCGGYPNRAAAAAALWDDWRSVHLRVALLVGDVVVPSPLDAPGRP